MVLGWMVLVSKAQGQETARQDAIQGYQFYLSKNYAYAEIYFRAAVRLDPRYASGYQALGNIYVFEGRKAEAVAEYQQALALRPDNSALQAYVQRLQRSMDNNAAPAPGTTTAQSAEQPEAPPNENDDGDYAYGIFGGFAGLGFWGSANNDDGELSGQDFGLAIGGGVYAGCQFDRHFSLSLNLTEYTFPVTNLTGESAAGSSIYYSIQEWQLMGVCRYILGDSGIRPYISLGMGTNLSLAVENSSDYSANYAQTAPIFQFGLGGMVPLSRDWDLFAEVDYDLVLYVQNNVDENYSFIPVNLGIQHNLP